MEQTKPLGLPSKTKEVAEVQTPVVPVTRIRETSRIPVSGPRDVLTLSNKDPNYSYRWVNSSIRGRIERFLAGGYEIVNHEAEVGQRTVDSGSRLGSAVTRQDGVNTLVAMRIPLQWYNEDQEAKMREVDALEDSMRADGGVFTGMSSSERPDSSTMGISRPVKR
jgi:hypothetical protein